jgi:hypothetical protein
MAPTGLQLQSSVQLLTDRRMHKTCSCTRHSACEVHAAPQLPIISVKWQPRRMTFRVVEVHKLGMIGAGNLSSLHATRRGSEHETVTLANAA